MDDDRFVRLTPRQLDCLRLLPVKGSSKGVAVALDISPSTVDHHLKIARRLLGVTDSWQAAVLVLDHLREHPQKLGTEPEAVVDRTGEGATGGGTNDGSKGHHEETALPQVMGETPVEPGTRHLWDMLFPAVGRPPNDLGIQARISVIAIQIFISTGAVSILLALVYALSLFLMMLARHGG